MARTAISKRRGLGQVCGTRWRRSHSSVGPVDAGGQHRPCSTALWDHPGLPSSSLKWRASSSGCCSAAGSSEPAPEADASRQKANVLMYRERRAVLPGTHGLQKPNCTLTVLETRGFGQRRGLHERNPLAHAASIIIDFFLWSGLGHRNGQD